MKRLLLIVPIALLTACDTAEQTVEETVLRPVRSLVISTNGEVRERTFSGVSQSTQESRMSFKVSGTVVDLPVQVGDQLSGGQLIASLNPSSYDLQVEQAEASLAQSQASQRNADANYERVKGLYENTNASRNDLDAARANAESAVAQVRSARKALEIAQLNRSYTRLTAASDCTVASIDVDLNENVNAGTQIAKVNCGAGIEVSLGIPESLIAGFTAGMPATVRFNAIPGRTFAGTVTEVGIASGGNAATFPVIVSLSESDRAIRPSLATDVTFEFQNSVTDGTVVPTAALIKDEQGEFVFIAEAADDGTAVIRRRAVSSGELTAEGVEIVTGVNPGDRVVTAGTTVIREGQHVLLPEG